MALKIRLARMGAKHDPVYRVVVAESSSPRDGRFVEILGTYCPVEKKQLLQVNLERADYWMGQGAQPSDTVRSLVKKARTRQEETAEAAPVEA